jgi:hypothetical protein
LLFIVASGLLILLGESVAGLTLCLPLLLQHLNLRLQAQYRILSLVWCSLGLRGALLTALQLPW